MKFELSEDGTLYRITDGARSAYDFNEEYRGYYAPCRFTALCEAGGQILLAGLDDAGWPHLFLSLMGTAFEERALVAASPISPPKRLRGEIFRILYEEDENQYYLVCRNGEIAVMPDCPKCMRIVSAGGRPAALMGGGSQTTSMDRSRQTQTVSSDRSDDEAFVDAELVTRQHAGESEAYLILTQKDGKTQEIPLSSLRQYRVSWSFAGKLVKSGALLVDVRESGTEAEAKAGPEAGSEAGSEASSGVAGCEKVPLADLGSWLQDTPRQQVLIFLCRTGHLADEAAEFARAQGFYRAFSAGGTEDWAHVE